ncbi:MAG: hypothetical protein R3B70_14715 [Polyangiaceae bacterium]
MAHLRAKAASAWHSLRGRPRQLDPDGGNATQILAYDSLSHGQLVRG